MPSAREVKMLQLIEAAKKKKMMTKTNERQQGQLELESHPPQPSPPEKQETDANQSSVAKKAIAKETPKIKIAPKNDGDTPPNDGETPPKKHEPSYDIAQSQFQAIGLLYGKIIQDEEGIFYLEQKNKRYRLSIKRKFVEKIFNYKEQYGDIPLFLKVYPRHAFSPNEKPKIVFKIKELNKENIWQDYTVGNFILRGVWQFIPQFKQPVISIYRNDCSIDPTERFKSSHLPVLMRREGKVQPFRFKPNTPKEKQSKRWYIQGKFRFLQERDCFAWIEDIVEATPKIPAHKKPVKAPREEKNQKQGECEDAQKLEGKESKEQPASEQKSGNVCDEKQMRSPIDLAITSQIDTLNPLEIRQLLHLSQKRMSHLLHVSSTTISRWEKTEANPNPEAKQHLAKLKKIADIAIKVYTPEGVEEFLSTPMEEFDGRTAYELISLGEHERVIAALAADREGLSC
jgi:DNA-binding transcriptional regulator YiaG